MSEKPTTKMSCQEIIETNSGKEIKLFNMFIGKIGTPVNKDNPPLCPDDVSAASKGNLSIFLPREHPLWDSFSPTKTYCITITEKP